MAEVKPFGALRFQEKAGDPAELCCPPYDIVSETERLAYLMQNPRNIIRLELPKEGANPYAAAGETLKTWLAEGALAQDSPPGFYLYEERFTAYGEEKRILGLVGTVRLEEWDKGVVLPHEETLSKAKEDRLNLMKATGCNFSSIYSLYSDAQGELTPRLDAACAGKPLLEFPSPDGIRHRVWRLTGDAEIARISQFFAQRKLYIADGHHRYETAINYRNHLREQGIVTTPDHPANFVLMTLVPMEHPGLVVFPTHRIVRDLAAFDGEALLTQCASYFHIADVAERDYREQLGQSLKAQRKSLVLYQNGKLSLLTLKDPAVMDELLPGASPACRSLDVNILHTLILERILGIDKENMRQQKNLTYTRDASEAIQSVRDGSANCCFLMNPTGVDEIAQVAAACEKMPQKSTYFYPKLITGHLMNRLL